MPRITDCISKIVTSNFYLNAPNENVVKEVLIQNVIANKYPHWQSMTRTIQDTLLLGESAIPKNAGKKDGFSFKFLNPFIHKQ